MKKILFTIFCFTILFMQLSASGVDASDLTIKKPNFDLLNLKQNGSLANPYITPNTTNLNFITELVLTLNFTSTTYNLNNFGNDPKLTNGLNIFYDQTSIVNNLNISKNADFDRYFDEFRIQNDDRSPHAYEIVGIYTFPEALVITNKLQLHFYVQDDLTALSTVGSFYARIEGYNIVSYSNHADSGQQDWLTLLENMWNAGLENQIILLLLVIIGPLLTWVTFKRLRNSV